MVRRQSGLNQSLQFRLALTISVVLLVLAASASVWSFVRTYNRVQTMQDRQMYALVNMVQDDNVSLVEDETANGNATAAASSDLPCFLGISM